MKTLFHLIFSIMLVLQTSQLLAQELISIHPENPGGKIEMYETVDENSKPEKISCETGGGGNYRLKLSETRTVEEDYKLDTIKTDKEEWTEEDEKEFDKKYNKEHQKELDDLWKQIVDAPQDIQAACKERLEDFIDSYWNHYSYCICEPDCKSSIQQCYIFHDIISIKDSKVEYRYKTSYSYLTEMDPPPHEVEMEFDLEIYYEAWIYFKIGCACQDIPDLVSVTPEEKGKDPSTAGDSGAMAVHMNPENSNKLTDVFITAKGTGRTTGNIAIITVENKSENTLTVLPQTAYIPSSGQYQPYIAIIPGTTLSPGTTIIPVDGFCADVHKPPVSNGAPMPPIEKWIPVGDPNAPIPEGSVNIIPTIPVLPFSPGDIPDLLTSPEYESTSTSDSDAPIIITWPGTDIPVGGTLVPGENPKQFAPVIVEVFEEVTEAVDVIQHSGKYSTPFSADTVKEDQALTQNVIWIYTAELSGNTYEKEDFGTNLYKQFETTTGRTVPSLPEEQKEKIDEGIDDFWNVFTAVGVEAKVLSTPN